MSVNKVILIGNVGKDPDVRTITSDSKVANFPLATSESYTAKSGEKVTNTDWHSIVAWRGLADICEKYIHKGQQIYLEGKIRTRTYDAPDGTKRYVTEIFADQIQMLGRKSDNNAAPSTEGSVNTNTNSTPGDSEEDDLPF